MCILLLLDVNWIQLIDGAFSSLCLYWFSVLLDMLIILKGMLKSPNIIVDSYISPCTSISFSSHSFDASLLSKYTLFIVFFWRIYLFIIMSYITLSLIISLALMSSLSVINIATPPFFWWELALYIFLYFFIFTLFMALYWKWVSSR